MRSSLLLAVLCAESLCKGGERDMVGRSEVREFGVKTGVCQLVRVLRTFAIPFLSSIMYRWVVALNYDSELTCSHILRWVPRYKNIAATGTKSHNENLGSRTKM